VKDPDGNLYTVDLVLEGDHLKGTVSMNQGGQTVKAKMDVARVK
jgi:hypothetical protein